MHQVQTIELKRDCAAVQIPAGHEVTLPSGTTVDVTQALGGTYTVHANGGLFRIAAKDADALGFENNQAPVSEPSTSPLSEQQVWDALRSCYDPEIPLNIVDLGLVYSMETQRAPGGGSAVHVRMTLTAPGCGMGGVIANDAEQKLLGLPGVEQANVEIVWEPQWHPSMISEHGRKVLGLDQ